MHHEVRTARRNMRGVVRKIDKHFDIVERNINETIKGFVCDELRSFLPRPTAAFIEVMAPYPALPLISSSG